MSFKSLIRKYSNILLPTRCLLCGYANEAGALICVLCHQNLPILPYHCLQCAQFMPYNPQIPYKCGVCLNRRRWFDRTYALFPYVLPIEQMIRRLKFQQQLNYANAFAALFIERIKSVWYPKNNLPEILMPIPLHATRLKERGFNQALEIAKPIAKTLQMTLDVQGVKRIKATLPQTTLNNKERIQNMKNAFRVDENYTGLKVALLDDVMTTGQTIEACAEVLKEKGAHEIDVWCCARR